MYVNRTVRACGQLEQVMREIHVSLDLLVRGCCSCNTAIVVEDKPIRWSQTHSICTFQQTNLHPQFYLYVHFHPQRHLRAPHPHTHTVIFLHGRGDNAHKFSDPLTRSRDSNGRTLAHAFPFFRWGFPQAPMRQCASSPQTWPQWFDAWETRDFREKLHAEVLKEVVLETRWILAEEAAMLGGRWDRVVLAGISMGGATAVPTLFNLNITEGGGLGAFICFSCRCPLVGLSLAEMRQVLDLHDVPAHDNVLRKTPMFLEHCVDDPLILVQNGRKLRDTLSGFGADVTWVKYPDRGHWFNAPTGTDDVVKFLNGILGGQAKDLSGDTDML